MTPIQKIILLPIFLVLNFSCSITPVGGKRDLGQMLPDQDPEFRAIPSAKGEKKKNERDQDDYDIINKMRDGGPQGHVLSGEEAAVKIGESRGHQRSGQMVMGGEEESQELIRHTSQTQLIKERSSHYRSALHLSYIHEDFDYSDDRGVFKSTFIDSGRKSKDIGFIFVGWSQYFGRMTFFDPYWLVNLGLGFHMGSPKFSGGESSDVDLRLWMIPVDLGLGFDFSLYQWIKLGAAGGPSAMGLWQNRSDMDGTEGASNRRQGSLGYFYEVHGRFNLSYIFTRSTQRMYTSARLAQYYLTLKLRGHKYENFKQKDFKTEGQSIGIGLTFEFL